MKRSSKQSRAEQRAGGIRAYAADMVQASPPDAELASEPGFAKGRSSDS